MYIKLNSVLHNTLCTVFLFCAGYRWDPTANPDVAVLKDTSTLPKKTLAFQAITHHSAELKTVHKYNMLRYHKQ